MPVTTERNEGRSLIRLEGECTVASAAELKRIQLEARAQGGDLCLDLERVEEIDITVMQLLWVALREADGKGAKVMIRLSEAAGKAARDAGFKQFPGESLQV